MPCLPKAYWTKQIIGIGIALVAFVAVSFYGLPATDRLRAPFFYVFGLLLLLLVLTPLGVQVNGQKAWLRLPVIGQFQPSEFAKIPTVLMLAKYFSTNKGRLSFRDILVGRAIFLGPVILILLEPDAGQAITYFPILAAMFFLSGVKIRYVVGVAVLAAVLIPTAWYRRRQHRHRSSDISRNASSRSSTPKASIRADTAITRSNRRSRSAKADSPEFREIPKHRKAY